MTCQMTMALMIPDMKCTIILIALLKGKCAFISHQFRTDSLLSSFIVSLPFSVTISKISMPIAMSTRVFRNLDSILFPIFYRGSKSNLCLTRYWGCPSWLKKNVITDIEVAWTAIAWAWGRQCNPLRPWLPTLVRMCNVKQLSLLPRLRYYLSETFFVI